MAQENAVSFASPNAQPFFFKGGPHGVLLIHGFTGSISHMRPLGDALAAAGFTVRGINLPGHATRYEDMAQCTWETWLQYAKEAVLQMKEQCEQVSVCGLSMGGVLTLLIAEQMKILSAIPISAPMGVTNKFIPLAKYFWRFMPVVRWREEPLRPKLLDPAYDLGYPAFPTRSAGDLQTLIRLARANLFNITCPVLAIQSHGDTTISPNSAQVILEGVKSSDKAMLWLEEVPHVCTISKEKDHIAGEMVKFLRKAENLSETR